MCNNVYRFSALSARNGNANSKASGNISTNSNNKSNKNRSNLINKGAATLRCGQSDFLIIACLYDFKTLQGARDTLLNWKFGIEIGTRVVGFGVSSGVIHLWFKAPEALLSDFNKIFFVFLRLFGLPAQLKEPGPELNLHLARVRPHGSLRRSLRLEHSIPDRSPHMVPRYSVREQFIQHSMSEPAEADTQTANRAVN